MLHLVTWVRKKDALNFNNSFAPYEECVLWNGMDETVNFDNADGLLLTGGEDISIEFHTEIPTDPSLIRETNPKRDAWEFSAVREALEKQMPILAIGRGLEIFNVVMGGTLHLHIEDHDDEPQENTQELRHDQLVTCKFGAVNSDHHQAVNKLADGMIVEAWCKADDIVEQARLQNYPFAIGVQYHPERHPMYRPLFNSYIEATREYKKQRGDGPPKSPRKKKSRK